MKENLIARVFGLLFIAIALSGCRSGRTLDHASESEVTLQFGQWNNQLAGLLRSNQVDLARQMLVLQVAMQAADVWRWHATSGVAPHEFEAADEFLRDAKPTVEEAIQSPRFSGLPSYYRKRIEDYLKAATRAPESER